MNRLALCSVFVLAALWGCQSGSNVPAPVADHLPATTGTETGNPAPTAPIADLPTPASLSKYQALSLPFELQAGLMEGDLDQLDWQVGSKRRFKTPEQVFATLACTEIEDTHILFELQAYNADGAPIGKAERIDYFTGIASSEGMEITSCDMSIKDNALICNCKDESSGKTTRKYRQVYTLTSGGVQVSK